MKSNREFMVNSRKEDTQSGIHELWTRTQQGWYNIEPEIIQNLISSMLGRLDTIKKQKRIAKNYSFKLCLSYLLLDQ